jgi:ZIP family zinc transporter
VSDNVILAFALTAFAGLSTGIGSFIAFFVKKANFNMLSSAMGFSAGVMIYISFVELFPQGVKALEPEFGLKGAGWLATAAFFGGILITALIDKAVPHFENPHEFDKSSEPTGDEAQYKGLYRMGIFTALVIGIHNFPEGMATFMGALKDPNLGYTIALAVAIHNIPEGIAVSTPIFYATGNRRKAFLLSVSSGLAEPIGALVGYLLLRPYLSDTTFGISFAAIAGIMVFISFDQLLPASRLYGGHHRYMYGLIAGMAIMALSLVLM